MAYALFEQQTGFLQKIASDDTHLAYVKHSHPLSIEKTITEAEFIKVRSGISYPKVDVASGNISWSNEGIDEEEANEGTDNESLGYGEKAQLDSDIAGLIVAIDQSVAEWPNSGMVPALNTFKSALQGFDTSSVSMPTTGILAKTLDANGISPAYIALQIP